MNPLNMRTCMHVSLLSVNTMNTMYDCCETTHTHTKIASTKSGIWKKRWVATIICHIWRKVIKWIFTSLDNACNIKASFLLFKSYGRFMFGQRIMNAFYSLKIIRKVNLSDKPFVIFKGKLNDTRKLMSSSLIAMKNRSGFESNKRALSAAKIRA